MARKDAADSGVVGDEGERVKARRLRLGMNQVQLASLAKVDRGTLRGIEEGKNFQASKLAKIEQALDKAELEAGMDVPPASAETDRLVAFEVTMPGSDAKVVVRGPVEDREALVEAVRELLQGRQKDE